MTESNYPNQYEISQALSEYSQRSFLLKFMQRRGIFITNAPQNIIADFLSGIFLDNDDLEEIRSEALHLNTKSSVAGFWLQPEGPDYDLIHELENYSNTIIDENIKMKLGTITGDNIKDFRSDIEYLQLQPGRVQFLQGTQRRFEFTMRKENDGRWEILVEGERSNDSNILEGWLKEKLPREIAFNVIDQNRLSTQQTIAFFDQLATRALTKEWRLVDVKRIVVKREKERDEDEDTEEIEDSVLTGIAQAILEGNDLRSNSFVKQCEESNYRFTAMTYRYDNIQHPYAIEIRAEFKGRPKVFEVGLDDYFIRSGIDGDISESTPSSSETQLLRRVYTEAKHLYDDLVQTPVPLRNI